MRIELHLLGRFAARLDGAPPRLLQVSAPRRRALLAYLAMQPGHAETRERLASLLWGDRFDKQARQSLRQCLVTLRKELAPVAGDLLLVERDTVALRAESLEVDARAFLACAAEDAGSVQAMTLYRGRFLDGLEIDTEPFADWLRGERARIDAAALRVFEAAALRLDKAGLGAKAIEAAERLVALDPAAEPNQRLLLRLCARHRGRDAALSQAETLTSYLRVELDADPEPETAALIADIRSGAVAAAVPVPARGREPVDGAAAGAGHAGSAIAQEAAPPPPARPRAGPAFLRSAAGGWAAALLALGSVFALAVGLDADAPTPDRTGAVQAADPWRSPALAGAAQAELQGLSAVVVLPFATESDGAGRVIADRITDDLINDLSRVPALRVISRGTSRRYAGGAVDVAAVGAELGVRYAVEGSVRLHGDIVRINVALTDPASRLQVWSERFERPRSDQPAIQDEIARGIARHLHVQILTGEDRRRAPADADVAALLAKGWAGMLRISAAGVTSGADRYFERVLARDPDNVSALIGLGAYNASVVAMFLVPDTEPHLTVAAASLTRAEALSPRASLTHYFRGILHKTRGEPHEALAAFGRVLELNPSFAPAYAQVGHVLSRIGRLGEAMEHVRYAIRLSPKDPNLGLWSLFGGQIELELGNDAAAMDWLTRAVQLDPRSPFAHATLAAVHALRGDPASVAKHADALRGLSPWLTPARMKERLRGLSDQDGEPRRLMEGLRLAFPDQT